tara:strand:- start:121 stop:2121 length:2001 start_codon:yes stop_codon:yes gene_type:complete
MKKFLNNNYFFIFGPFLILWSLRYLLPNYTIISKEPHWAYIPPKSCLGGCGSIDGLIPFVEWTNNLIQFLRKYEFLGLFTFRDITRGLANWVDYFLKFTEALLHKGFSNLELGPLPWIIILTLTIILGMYLKGWRLALLGGACFMYLILFSKRGIWELSMKTLAAISVSAPLAALIGLGLGILAAKRIRFNNFLWPILNVLQSLPHFSYLILVVIFFGIGTKAGVIATIIFAFPPMARLTILGLKGISTEVKEAGVMAGCNKWQMLFKVEIPSARSPIMLGVNQVIMQCLAMVVIAAFIGQPGLGHDLLIRLQGLRLGEAFEIGVAVVLIAITLDRYSQALALKEPERREGNIVQRNPFISATVFSLVICSIIVYTIPFFNEFPKEFTISASVYLDNAIKSFTRSLFVPLGIFRDWMLIYFLMPMKAIFQSMPWTGVMILIGAIGFKIGKWKLALTVMVFVFFIASSGYWVRAMITVYMVFASLLICALMGIPLGIWASKKANRSKFVLNICDIFQTFPSFIYLLPAIMLFQISDVSAIFAIVIYSSIPMIRYTIFGLRSIPYHIIEAAITSGCNERQLLWKVKMPLAFPEIILGANQTLMFSLFMVMIAGFIGTVDLSQEIFRALSFSDGGKGLIIGLCVAFIGLAADQIMRTWAENRKIVLGII